MERRSSDTESKSAEMLAFEFYLRTGRRLIHLESPERKFNPYHDPRNGQFTFAPGGPRSIADPIFSDRRGRWKPRPTDARAKPLTDGPSAPKIGESPKNRLPVGALRAAFELAGGGRGPRRGRGRGGGRPDPTLLEDLFPGLRNSPVGTIVKAVDGFLELTSAAQAVTSAVHQGQVRRLLAEIQAIDPDYVYHSLGPPKTLQGQVNEINKLRSDRAMALYRVRGDDRALQVETFRFLQRRVDAAYEQAVALDKEGRLRAGYNRNHAIGNYIDMMVRRDLQEYFDSYGIDYSTGPVRVNSRQYDTSKSEPTYVVPDASVGLAYYDWTMRAKRPGSRQVRGFFDSDVRPAWTMIIRPSQLGSGHTYIIKSPRR